MQRSVHPTAAASIVCLIFLAAVVPLILSGFNNARSEADQRLYHLRAIQQFARQWPHFDFSDYPSATTPGYHLAIAAVERFVSSDLRVMRLLASLFSIGFLATLALFVGRRVELAFALALCLPLVCLIYVITAAVWLLPDNAGWWAALVALLIALRRPIDRLTWIGGALALVAVVAFRQSHLWVILPMGVAIGFGARGRQLVRRLVGMVMMSVAALAMLAWFVLQWHGLIPPSQRVNLSGTNPAGPAVLLCALAVLGLFYLPFFLPRLTGRQRLTFGTFGASIGFLAGALPITTYSIHGGRFGGIWNIAARFPYMAGHSPLIIAVSAVGGAVTALWLGALPRRESWTWGSTVVAFALVQIASNCAFDRYDDPLILMAFALSICCLPPPLPRAGLVGSALLCLLLAATTIVTL